MAPSAAPSAAASAAALTGNLTIWEAYGASGVAEKDAFDQILQNVQAANPGLTVTDLDVPFNNLFTKFETSAASSGVPDLFIAPADSLPKEARAGLLVDLTSILPQLSNFSPAAIQGATVDGKLYAIPESMKGVALFYNTSLLPTAPATTDDWMTDASKLGWVYGANGGGSPACGVHPGRRGLSRHAEPILGFSWQISRSSRPTPAARSGSSGLSTPMARSSASWKPMGPSTAGTWSCSARRANGRGGWRQTAPG
jgi:spermidine/putrescine-binding protein